MVSPESSERKKNKPRGRPFSIGNKLGKNENEISTTSGHKSNNERGIVAKIADKHIEESVKSVLHELPDLVMKTCDNVLKENMEEKKDEKKPLELIETLEFFEGENKLTIRFSKKHNRMYRVQIFLNDKMEIRPVTYTGGHAGYGFWNLLKGCLKK